MKRIITTLALTVIFCCSAKSQSDTLAIKLKDGTIDKIPVSLIQKIKFESLTGVIETQQAFSNINLNGNHPNPFAEQTEIEFEIIESGNVEINIFNNSGNRIQTINCTNCKNGKNFLTWNCLDYNNQHVQSGTYYYEVRFRNELQTRKMIVIK